MSIGKTKEVPVEISIGKRVMYGVMGSAAAVGSVLAGSCLSRCNGCMGCLAGGAGIVGIIAGSKLMEKFSGAVKGNPVRNTENKSSINKQ